MKRVRFTLFIILIALFAIFMFSNYTVGVSRYTLESEKLPYEFDGFKIVQLSDLHNRRHPFIMSQIDKENPDIVVLTGDMVSSDDTDFSPFLSLAEKIATKYPTYFILGNHEQMLPSENYERLISEIADTSVIILDNSCVPLERNGEKINLYGMWFNLRYYRDLNDEKEAGYYVDKAKINELLGEIREGYNLLLTHSPVFFDGYCDWGADLILSGHMHGGMIRIPWLGGLFSPEREYFPEYDAGLFEKGESKLVISRGLGEHTGFRVFNRPEIVSVKLCSK